MQTSVDVLFTTETMDKEKLFRREAVTTFLVQICLLYISDLSHALIPNKETKKQREKRETAPKKNGSAAKARLAYFQRTFCPQQQQNIFATVCMPESIILSSKGTILMFTLVRKFKI